jgi:hypothetical protein
MNVLVGLALSALALLAPYPTNRGRVWSLTLVVVRILQGGARIGVGMGGVYYAFGRSARDSAVAGAIVGSVFALIMGAFVAAVLAYMYLFRRSWWDFNKAWSEAGLSTKPSRFGGVAFGGFRQAQARSRLSNSLRREWEHRANEDQTAEEFVREHTADIEARRKELN